MGTKISSLPPRRRRERGPGQGRRFRPRGHGRAMPLRCRRRGALLLGPRSSPPRIEPAIEVVRTAGKRESTSARSVGLASAERRFATASTPPSCFLTFFLERADDHPYGVKHRLYRWCGDRHRPGGDQQHQADGGAAGGGSFAAQQPSQSQPKVAFSAAHDSILTLFAQK